MLEQFQSLTKTNTNQTSSNTSNLIKEFAYEIKNVVTQSAQLAMGDLISGEKIEFEQGGDQFRVEVSRNTADSQNVCDVGQSVNVSLMNQTTFEGTDQVDCIFMFTTCHCHLFQKKNQRRRKRRNRRLGESEIDSHHLTLGIESFDNRIYLWAK